MTGLGEQQPSEGGRLHAALERLDASGATYAATLSTGEGRWQGRLHLDTAAKATLEGADAAPAWLKELACAVLRTTCRGTPPEGWPRRITRWRPSPEPNHES